MSGTKDPIAVPYGKSVHGQEEIDAVVSVLNTSTQMGEKTETFEKRVASLFDKKYGVMVNSGSSALLLAHEILQLPPGSEVITPALTFATTVSSIIKNNLVPVFVDVDEASFCIDPMTIEPMINENTRAICAPNLIGNIANWPAIRKIADKHNLIVIEDSADTLGGTLGNRSSGADSHISITSFYGSHIINCAGNGGMLCMNDPEQFERAKLLRSWGRSSSLFEESEKIENRFNIKVDGVPYDQKFVFGMVGYNLEPSELGAAFGLVQLNKLDANIDARIHHFNQQLNFFRGYQQWFILPEQTPDSRTGWLAFPVIIKDDAPFSRQEMQIYLEQRNIQTRVIFTGNILRQPGFTDINCRTSPDGYANSDQVMRGGMLLGCHHGLTQAMMDHVHQSCLDFFTRFS
jgi:CDP-6-deoxy-D-xylo-4-hexulose-3-dehydrase